MTTPLYEIRKVFHYHEMPAKIRAAVMNAWDDMGHDSFVSWSAGDTNYDLDDPCKQVDDWLAENGADKSIHEEVLILVL